MTPEPEAPPPGLAPGERLGGRYEIVRPLGSGGFAHTVLARDLESGRDVALKTLRGHAGVDLKTYQLFEREATVLLGLRHRGIPEFHAFLRADVGGTSAAVLVMEFIEGVSLGRIIDERRVLAPAQVLDLLLELLGILDYLHTRVPPILHRDIKPDNVVIRTDGGPVLVDFGAVRNVFRAPGESGSTVVGTYGYMPYEQYLGHATPSSDLYALGATFLHLVTGRPPREFMNPEGRLAVPPDLPVGEPLRGVIGRLLESAPARRFPSARAAREAALGGTPGTALAPVGSTALVALPPAPRTIDGPTAERFRAVAHSAWQLMDPTTQPGDGWDLFDILSMIFFSTITAGVLPLVFIGVARARRRRLRTFFQLGTPAVATVHSFKEEEIAFGAKVMRVGYEFVADGRSQRGSDVVLPYIAARWRDGDAIEILYLAERDYDSVIISGR